MGKEDGSGAAFRQTTLREKRSWRHGGLSEWGTCSAFSNGVGRPDGSNTSDAEGIYFEGIRGVSEAVAFGESADHGLFCIRDEYEESFDSPVFSLGERVSASTVSEVAKGLDEAVKRYHERKIVDGYRFLFFDGVVLKQRGVAKVQKKTILSVYGETWEGKREMIDFLLATSESQNAWEGFLRNLYERGLEGKHCEIITSDGGKGLRNALEVVYPRIPRQHCWAHKTRNVLDKVKKVDQEKVKKELHGISHAKNRQAATQAYWSFCHKYRKIYPDAVKRLSSEIDDFALFLSGQAIS